MNRSPIAALVCVLAVAAVAEPPTVEVDSAVIRPLAASASTTAGFTRWDSATQLRLGTRSGLRVRRGALVLDAPTARRGRRGTTYDVGTWTSPWTTPSATPDGFTSLISSWSARTPGDSWVEVRSQVATPAAQSRWQVLGRWATSDAHLRRTSVPGQADALGRVATDTWQATSVSGATSYRLQVRVMRRAGATTAAPSVAYVGAVAARVGSVPAPSAPGPARGVTLAVPTYSQMVHRGRFPQYGGGGEAWCSPTSTAMVLGYYGRLPGAGATRWAGSDPAPWVAEAARRTYDVAYRGTGNWPFNTAYAASRGLDAFVTRLRSLREAEGLIAAGIPVVLSVSFSSGQLAGAPISATAGHLLVLVGFTAAGDPIVNDPAGSADATVRRTYDRAQLETAWLGGSGGTAYVIHDAAHPLPASSGAW